MKNRACRPREPRGTGPDGAVRPPTGDAVATAGATAAAAAVSCAVGESSIVPDSCAEENDGNGPRSIVGDANEPAPEPANVEDDDEVEDESVDDVDAKSEEDEEEEENVEDVESDEPDDEDPVTVSFGGWKRTSKPSGTAPEPAGTIINDGEVFSPAELDDNTLRTSAVHLPSAALVSGTLALSHSGLGALSRDCFGPAVQAFGVGHTWSCAPDCWTPPSSARVSVAVSMVVTVSEARIADTVMAPLGPDDTASPRSGAVAVGFDVHHPTSTVTSSEDAGEAPARATITTTVRKTAIRLNSGPLPERAPGVAGGHPFDRWPAPRTRPSCRIG